MNVVKDQLSMAVFVVCLLSFVVFIASDRAPTTSPEMASNSGTTNLPRQDE